MTPTVVALHWLSVKYRIQNSSPCDCWAVQGYTTDLLQPIVTDRSPRSSDQGLLVILKRLKTKRDCAFEVVVPGTHSSFDFSFVHTVDAFCSDFLLLSCCLHAFGMTFWFLGSFEKRSYLLTWTVMNLKFDMMSVNQFDCVTQGSHMSILIICCEAIVCHHPVSIGQKVKTPEALVC